MLIDSICAVCLYNKKLDGIRGSNKGSEISTFIGQWFIQNYLIQFFLVLMSEARRTFEDQLEPSLCFLEESSHIFVSVMQLD